MGGISRLLKVFLANEFVRNLEVIKSGKLLGNWLGRLESGEPPKL